MAKAYKFTEEKRAWAQNVSAGLKTYAEKSRCPECKRKNAFHQQAREYNLQRGRVWERCRYCRFERIHHLDTGVIESRFGNVKAD